jgi:hypothetical protein
MSGEKINKKICCSTRAKNWLSHVGFNIADSKNKRRTTTSIFSIVVLPSEINFSRNQFKIILLFWLKNRIAKRHLKQIVNLAPKSAFEKALKLSEPDLHCNFCGP